jgi:cob(I)alamin adenosyltransferase
MKDYQYSELKTLSRFNDLITIDQFGNDSFVFKKEEPSDEIKKEIKLGIEKAYNAMISNSYDLIILDESLVSIYFGLITKEDLIPFFTDKPENVELIFTGRYCPQELIDMADLVTEMKEIKHYYQKGILSRKGIEA